MSTIKSSTTTTTAYSVTADTTGALVFQTGATPTTAMTLGADQSVTFAGAQTYTGASTFTSGITVQGLTVGRGAGAVSTNTAVGASALAANTSGASNTANGYQALKSVVGGSDNTAFGTNALRDTSTGNNNTSVGSAALIQNTTGANNVAVGQTALFANTTASNNTAVGYQAGYSQTTADGNALFGYQAGTTLTTGNLNSFFGAAAGGAITTGAKNTILGRFNGNAGGLDIRTASNYIVLSDGDGTPVFWTNGVFIQGSAFNSNRNMGTTDMNTVKTSGLYRFDSGTPNTPTNTFYSVVVYGNGDNVVAQLATVFQGSATYTRSFNTSWSAWVQL